MFPFLFFFFGGGESSNTKYRGRKFNHGNCCSHNFFLITALKTLIRRNQCQMPPRASTLAYRGTMLTTFVRTELNRVFKVTKLWSPDGGNEASTTRRSNANPDSLSTMDKNAISMTMENSQLKKLLAEVSLCPNVKISRK